MAASTKHAVSFKVVAKCSVTKARVSQLSLPHYLVDTPVFMPVGTQGSLKGLLPEQLKQLNCGLILGNTYHLGHRPGPEILKRAGGLHSFMGWDRALLTDSGGFQMVSLLDLAEITEEGVRFKSPHDGTMMLLTPEHSMEIQNAIGADIMMALDDVVSSLTEGPRVEEAMHRTIRWLDRCIKAHKHPEKQSIFPIVQGGLDPKLRAACAKELTKRDVAGFAIGGLSGGEAKSQFWKMVDISTDYLPTDKPRYLMGVGYAVDLVVCSALGCDMFDCVYPTRTARFGVALRRDCDLRMSNKEFAEDLGPLDENCSCSTCRKYSRAHVQSLVYNKQAVACSLLTVHNVCFQMSLMANVRTSILEDRFPAFVKNFMKVRFPDGQYPDWVEGALGKVGIHLQ